MQLKAWKHGVSVRINKIHPRHVRDQALQLWQPWFPIPPMLNEWPLQVDAGAVPWLQEHFLNPCFQVSHPFIFHQPTLKHLTSSNYTYYTRSKEAVASTLRGFPQQDVQRPLSRKYDVVIVVCVCLSVNTPTWSDLCVGYLALTPCHYAH